MSSCHQFISKLPGKTKRFSNRRLSTPLGGASEGDQKLTTAFHSKAKTFGVGGRVLGSVAAGGAALVGGEEALLGEAGEADEWEADE